MKHWLERTGLRIIAAVKAPWSKIKGWSRRTKLRMLISGAGIVIIAGSIWWAIPHKPKISDGIAAARSSTATRIFFIHEGA